MSHPSSLVTVKVPRVRVCLVCLEMETMLMWVNNPCSPSLTAAMTSIAWLSLLAAVKSGLDRSGRTPQLRLSVNTWTEVSRLASGLSWLTSLQVKAGAVQDSTLDRLWFLAVRLRKRNLLLAQETEVK